MLLCDNLSNASIESSRACWYCGFQWLMSFHSPTDPDDLNNMNLKEWIFEIDLFSYGYSNDNSAWRCYGANFLIRASENPRMVLVARTALPTFNHGLENGPYHARGSLPVFRTGAHCIKAGFHSSRSHRPGVYRSSECLWMASTV